jgi:hypothetical protein
VALEVFEDIASHGAPGAIFTRTPPGVLREKYGIKRTPLYWVGLWVEPRPPPGYTQAVHRIEDLIHAVKDFMATSQAVAAGHGAVARAAESRGRGAGDPGTAPGAVVLVDGLAHLIQHYGFPAVRDMAAMLKEAALLHRCVFLLRADPRVLEEKQMAELEQELEVWG